MMWPNPLVFYAAGGALLIGVASGYKVRDWQCGAAQADALREADKQTQEMQDEVATQAVGYEAARGETYGVGARVEREVRTLYREVPAPPAGCAPPDFAIGLLQGRVDHANASASGKPSE
jgi:hypothetical protein